MDDLIRAAFNHAKVIVWVALLLHPGGVGEIWNNYLYGSDKTIKIFLILWFER